jgi:hypothetical protein
MSRTFARLPVSLERLLWEVSVLRGLATAITVLFLMSATHAAACAGPPWWNIGLSSADGQVMALWRGAIYRIDPSDGAFEQVSAAPADGGSLCFRDGALYAVSAARFPPSVVAVLKTLPIPVMTPHQDVGPSLWRVETGGLVNVAQGPRLAYHYGAAPLAGGRAVFIGYRHGAIMVADQDSAVWKRQVLGDPTILQTPAGLGVGPGGAIHTVIVTRREAVVTTFDSGGRLMRDIRLDLPQEYWSARVDRRFVKAVGGADQTYFLISAGREDPGHGRSSMRPLLIAVGHDGAASLRQAPSVLAQTCSAYHVAINRDRVAVLCGIIGRPVVALWSLSSGQVRQVEVSDALLRPSGYLKAALILAPATGAGFTLLALEGGGDAAVLRTVYVQPIG